MRHLGSFSFREVVGLFWSDPFFFWGGGGHWRNHPCERCEKVWSFRHLRSKLPVQDSFGTDFFGVEEVDFLEGVGQEKRIHVGFVYFSGHPPQNDLAPGQICWIFVWFCCCSYSSWFGCFAPMGNSCANLILALQNIRPGGAPKKHPLFGGSI